MGAFPKKKNLNLNFLRLNFEAILSENLKLISDCSIRVYQSELKPPYSLLYFRTKYLMFQLTQQIKVKRLYRSELNVLLKG